jgi:AcrR family transcriptional regulator
LSDDIAKPGSRPRRGTYRHGNLRQALLEAGTELARAGGPEAVVLREATRCAEVAPNAAYRHFPCREALVEAVSLQAMGALAQAMEEDQAAVPALGDPAALARARFRALGAGYLRFARTEPGLFRCAFSVPADMAQAQAADSAGTGGRTPFQLLSTALDGLVTHGLMPEDRRPGAEVLVWSCVHGLAVLLTDGPLRGLEDAHADRAVEDLIDLIERGLPLMSPS